MLCTITIYGQQDKKTVVMGASLSNNAPEWIRDLIMESLKEGLSNTGKYKVLENRDIYAKVATSEATFQQSGWVDENQMLQLGKVAGADYACYAKIIKMEESYRIVCNMTDLKEGSVIPFSITAKGNENDLIAAADEIINALTTGKKSLAGKKNTDVLCPACYWNGYQFVDGYIYYQDEMATTWQNAVNKCRQKGEGWYLPSKEELQMIYKNRNSIKGDGLQWFKQNDYWSSSQRNNYDAYTVNFSDGSIDYFGKDDVKNCRCVKTAE